MSKRCDGQTALFIYLLAQVLKVCRTPGPTACSKTLATEGAFELYRLHDLYIMGMFVFILHHVKNLKVSWYSGDHSTQCLAGETEHNNRHVLGAEEAVHNLKQSTTWYSKKDAHHLSRSSL